MQSYRELIVWQKAMQLVTCAYQITKLLPQEETYALSDQIRRAAISIPSNIAEGYGRGSNKDYAHFLYIAKGSVNELDTQIRAAIMLHFVDEEKCQDVLALCEECSKILWVMIKKIQG